MYVSLEVSSTEASTSQGNGWRNNTAVIKWREISEQLIYLSPFNTREREIYSKFYRFYAPDLNVTRQEQNHACCE